MRKYFDLTSWFILFALLPFSVLALLSQNSVPGDFFYPVKRGLENMILVASSVHPATRVTFRTDLTERRFREAEQLLIAKADVRGLDEFIQEIQTTQNEVSTFSDPVKRVEFTEKLLEQIESYETKLAQAQIQVQSQPTPVPQAPAPAPEQVTQPTPVPVETVPPTQPPAQPTPQPVQTPTPKPIIPGIPISLPKPSPSPISEIKKEIVKVEIENTKKKLEEVKEKLSREAGSRPAGKEEREKTKEERKEERKEEKPVPQSGIPLRGTTTETQKDKETQKFDKERKNESND